LNYRTVRLQRFLSHLLLSQINSKELGCYNKDVANEDID